MSPTYREATINSIEAVATVSGSTGGGRDESGKPYFYTNTPVSIGYWFDNEGLPSSDWDTHFTAELWIDGKLIGKKQDLVGSGPQTYTFFAHKFTEPGTYKVEVRGKNTQSMTVTIKNPAEAPPEPKRATH